MSAHTPGPWEAEEVDGGLWVTGLPDHDASVVCDLVARTPHAEPTDEDRANANLIAAAQELYDALDALYRWEQGDTSVPALDPVLQAARAALARARGEPTEE